MDHFEELLKALSEILSCPIHMDNKSSCLLVFEGNVPVQIELDKSQDYLIAGVLLGDVPAGKYRENLLLEALKDNRFAPQEVFAWSLRKSQPVLFIKQPFSEATAPALFESLKKLVEKAKIWREAIARADIPTSVQTSSLPSPFAIKK